jgi:fucose permease
LGLYFNIVVGSQWHIIEVRIIWYQSLGSKIKFTIILPFVCCYHPILFLLYSLFLVFILYCAPSSKKEKKKKKTSQKEKRKKKERRHKKKKKVFSGVLFLLM